MRHGLVGTESSSSMGSSSPDIDANEDVLQRLGGGERRPIRMFEERWFDTHEVLGGEGWE
jgi:hypothetical protein